MGISIGAAIKSITKDPEWMVKTGILSICFIISGFGQMTIDYIQKTPNVESTIIIAAIILLLTSILASLFSAGYMFQYLHNIRSKPTANLPDWDNWGNLLKIGFWGSFMPGLVYFLIGLVSAFIVTLVVTIPLLIYYAYCSSGLALAYAEEFDGGVFFHPGKAKPFLGWNYFWFLLASFLVLVIAFIPIGIFSYLAPTYSILALPLYAFAIIICYALLGQVFHLECPPDSDHSLY